MPRTPSGQVYASRQALPLPSRMSKHWLGGVRNESLRHPCNQTVTGSEPLSPLRRQGLREREHLLEGESEAILGDGRRRRRAGVIAAQVAQAWGRGALALAEMAPR